MEHTIFLILGISLLILSLGISIASCLCQEGDFDCIEKCYFTRVKIPAFLATLGIGCLAAYVIIASYVKYC